MSMIHIIRDVPEYKGGSCEMDIQEQDLPTLQYRGWRVAEAKKVEPKKEEPKVEAKPEVTEPKKEDTGFKGFKKGDK